MSTSEQIILDPVTRESGTNLILNPSFETGTTHWGQYLGTTGSLSRVTTDSVFGGACLRQINPGTNVYEGAKYSGIGSPLTIGVTYTVAAYVKATAGKHFYFDFLVSSGSAPTLFVTTGAWQRVECTQVATTATLETQILNNGAFGAEAVTIYIDGVQMIAESSASPYFDGDSLSDSPLTSFAWNGTAHDSTSTAVTTRTEFDITDWIAQAGIDWGEASIEPFMAQRDRGEVPVDFRVPNRSVSVPLTLVDRGTVTGKEVRAAIQAKAGMFQKEGGLLRRVTNAGGTVYADVVDASFSATSVSGWESEQDVDIDAQLSLTCLPDFYEAEQILSDHSETVLPELTFTETTIEGDYPARVRLVVDEDSGNSQSGLAWGFRSRHYDSATTAALAYEAESLTPIGSGAAAATTGASGGTAVKVAPLWPTWTPLLSTGDLTHTGSYNVFARCVVSGTVQTQVRLSWNVGDLVNPVTNSAHTLPNPGAGTVSGTAIYDVQLGEVRLDPSPVGTHRWQGQIDAQTFNTTLGTADFRVDRIEFQPVDEGAGILTSPPVSPTTTQSLVGFDAFEQTAGTLTAAVAPLGGTWTVLGTAGTETGGTADFNLYGSPNFSVYRNQGTADTSLTNGRFVTLGATTYDAVDARVDVTLPYLAANGEAEGGLIFRASTTDVYLKAVRRHTMLNPVTAYTWLDLIKKSAGIINGLGSVLLTGGFQTGAYTLRVTIDTDGNIAVYTAPAGSSDLGAAKLTVTDDTLAAGKVGLYDASTLASAGLRIYDNFRAYTPVSGAVTQDAVIYANRSCQLTTDGMFRLDTGGTAYGPVSSVVGDLPRLPVTAEGRTTEVFLKASRGDFNTIQDDGIDDISARAFYRPSWLFVDDT